ncbi:MAG: C39 family peptidase [Anaerolineae bacterium]|nr:C39 family peptidase [Anaerolineae bacterium]
MVGKKRWVLMVIALAMLAGGATWWALPRLPGRVRAYLPEPVAALVTTPLPAALPTAAAPTAAVGAATTLVATVDLAQLVAEPPASPTAQSAPPPAATAGALLPTPTLAVATPTLAPSLPPYGRVTNIPIIPQKFNNCGPTNLTLVLNHYGIDVDQFDVAAVARPNYEDRNVSPGELVDYVNEHTALRAVTYVGGDIDTLRALLAAGVPVIIETGLEPDAATGWMGHYLTVFAYDDITRHFSVRDTYLGPWQGEGLAGYDETARTWAQFNGAFVVVYPPERAADVAAALGPAFADAGAMWAAAVARAREAARTRPDDPFAWFNLGSGLTALAGQGDAALAAGAAAAFDRARQLGLPPRMLWYQFAPYEAYLAAGRPGDVLALTAVTLENQGGRNVEETYLYQGLALLATGDAAGARAALARAVELNAASPTGEAAQAALDGL